MAASPSSSSITNDGYECDVFLNFRGPDTRRDFIGNIWNALHNRGIRTFRDDLYINKGKNIDKSLIEAIEKSKAAIVVLSPDYATSSFCLDELCHILKYMKGNGRFVWPIFYDVDPSIVRWSEKGTYGKAMDEHVRWRRKDKLKEWKDALKEVADLSGTVYKWKTGHGYEYEFINKIVREVSRVIQPSSLSIPDYIVGLETQKQHVLSLLNVGSDDNVYMVGIHGIGGIGKTTLAQVVYNSIVDQFDGSCYLEDVRGNHEKNGLIHLQNTLLSEIFGENQIVVKSYNKGIKELRVRLKQKKVLLLLDNVDKLDQLRAIVGEPGWFGCGSRVIITTRDTEVLRNHGVQITHEVEILNEDEAYNFLRWKTFKTNEVSPIFEDVFNRALTYTSGLPLAIETIGSHLFSKTIEEWKSALDRYEKIPKQEIFEILKVSFDALVQGDKDVFLDIACFFKGYSLEKVEKILHAHYGDEKKDHINVLIEKSLIKLSESNALTLHDLIEDMGKEIVRLESPDQPGKRSRLLLEENTYFKNMRFLRFHDCNSLTSIPDVSGLQNLEEFSCRACHALITIDDSIGILGKLQIFNVEYCSRLQTIPSLKLPSLEELTLSNLHSIKSLSPMLDESLDQLKFLRVHNCPKIKTIPPLKLASLEELSLEGLSSIESLSATLDESLDKLKILKVVDCAKLQTIPSLKFASLEKLNLSRLRSIESLYPLLADQSLDKLKVLKIKYCYELWGFPAVMLPSLEILDLSYCKSLKSFPRITSRSMTKLKELRLDGCANLWKLPAINVASLDVFDCSGCESLELSTSDSD